MGGCEQECGEDVCKDGEEADRQTDRQASEESGCLSGLYLMQAAFLNRCFTERRGRTRTWVEHGDAKPELRRIGSGALELKNSPRPNCHRQYLQTIVETPIERT